FRARVRSKPQGCDRGHDRGRSGRGMRKGTYGRAKRVDRKRRRPFTRSRFCRRRGLEQKRRLAKNAAGARWPTAAARKRAVGHWASRLASLAKAKQEGD